MATFVLVHGAWHGGGCYKRVAARLLRQTLTGFGEHARLLTRAAGIALALEDERA